MTNLQKKLSTITTNHYHATIMLALRIASTRCLNQVVVDATNAEVATCDLKGPRSQVVESDRHEFLGLHALSLMIRSGFAK